jgi:hypothetical protein
MEGEKSRRQSARWIARRVAMASIGEERLREGAHFDIANIEGGRDVRVAQWPYCAKDVVTRWRQTEMRLAFCAPVSSKHCSLKREGEMELETAGSDWAEGALATIMPMSAI